MKLEHVCVGGGDVCNRQLDADLKLCNDWLRSRRVLVTAETKGQESR